MKGLLLVILVVGLSADPVAGSFFANIWESEKDFFDKINEKIEESNKTDLPTSQPMKPTLTPTIATSNMPSVHPSSSPTISNGPSFQPSTSPTASSEPSNQPTSEPSANPSMSPSSLPSSMPSREPSLTPTNQPSDNPTKSAYPSSKPSIQPTISASPSSEPSLNPSISTSPSSQPSEQPTVSTSPSTIPSLAPSVSTMPTDSPSSEPTSVPSTYPSTSPSLLPTTVPSLSPSDEPSSVPSEVPTETKPIITRIIIKSDSPGRNLIAVGSVSLLLLASAAAFVSKNAKGSKEEENNDMGEIPGLQFTRSLSQHSDESEQYGHDAPKLSVDLVGQMYAKNREDYQDDADFEDIDLEYGQEKDIIQTEDSVAESSIDLNSLPGNVKDKTLNAINKVFRRRPMRAEKQQPMSWMDIRDAGSPACSSGCEPAKGENSVASRSARFSPFVLSARMRMQSLMSISSEETDDLPSVEGSIDGNDKLDKCVVSPTIIRENEVTSVPESFNGRMTNRERQLCSDSPSIFDGIHESNSLTESDCVGSPDSIFNGLRDLSPDGRANQNMDQLRNILGTIKTRGSYEESFISASSAGTSVTDFKNKAKARLGLNQSQAQNASKCSIQEKDRSRHEINMPCKELTFEKELLNASESNSDDAVGFNFEHVFTDPSNEICECHVPSGPLGIVVKATRVGLGIQKINSMSPFCNKLSVGDIIIAVDEVDVVGVESGFFWQLVSRRANKQQRCFVALKI